MSEVWVLSELDSFGDVAVKGVFSTLDAARSASREPLLHHEWEGCWSSRHGESMAERFTVDEGQETL